MFNKEDLSLLLRLYNGPVDENALKIQITQINSSFILYLKIKQNCYQVIRIFLPKQNYNLI